MMAETVSIDTPTDLLVVQGSSSPNETGSFFDANDTSNPPNIATYYSSSLYYANLMTRLVVPISFCIIAVLGIIGNLLVISVVCSNSRMRNTTNALIINLAVADLAFIVICVPFTAVSYSASLWLFGSLWCKAYNYVINVTAYVSVYTLVMMALDRYLAVAHAISSMTLRTERNASVAIALVWMATCAFNVPVWLEHDELKYSHMNTSYSKCMNVYIFAGGNGTLSQARGQVGLVRFFFSSGCVLAVSSGCVLSVLQ